MIGMVCWTKLVIIAFPMLGILQAAFCCVTAWSCYFYCGINGFDLVVSRIALSDWLISFLDLVIYRAVKKLRELFWRTEVCIFLFVVGGH